MMRVVEPVLFLHPFGLDGSAADWLHVPGVVSPTLPNHPGAIWPVDTHLDLVAITDLIASTIKDPHHVVGCSIGGVIALHLALRHPDLVSSLVLACTAAAMPREVILARAEETVETDESVWVDATLSRWFDEPALSAGATTFVRYSRERLLLADRSALAAVWRAVAEHDVRDRLSEISVPTTCIAGNHDVSAPIERLRELAEGIAGSSLKVLDTGHMAFLEQPAEFSALVREHQERPGSG